MLRKGCPLLLALVMLTMAGVFAAHAAQSPFGVGLQEPAASPGGLFSSFFAYVAQEQARFYRALQEALKAMKADGTAGLWLVALSFAYGIFHAAGPGHGKAVISSYVLANGETLKRGIALSFASALLQAVTAVALISVAAVLLNLTSIAITETTRWFEIGASGLVLLLGLSLVWSKILRPSFQQRPALVPVGGHDHHDGHGHHHHHHHHHVHGEACASCGHSHAPDPAMIAGPFTLAKGWSAIVAVGLRPCTGALVVLVFALAQGLLWAGIAATFAMALGTGITVSILAAMAVGAKGVALRLFGSEGRAAERIHRFAESLGAILVLLLGAILFTAAVGYGA
ncbi:nickel/cobalt transporter [Stappia sp. F7233]|uniref:Nickel/cobalt efflux system n=1 Tax=Stappia albiluteola TaxID=2758565 RepID=A0A839AEI2_9HYPH|nr:nickel/cobalt transporter [Stappia albiluteola]MBA5777364.1 nickel/cobalt transporter [Stappia albiluteola]